MVYFSFYLYGYINHYDLSEKTIIITTYFIFKLYKHILCSLQQSNPLTIITGLSFARLLVLMCTQP